MPKPAPAWALLDPRRPSSRVMRMLPSGRGGATEVIVASAQILCELFPRPTPQIRTWLCGSAGPGRISGGKLTGWSESDPRNETLTLFNPILQAD